MSASVSGALGAIGLALAATPAPVAVAPGIYALTGQPGEKRCGTCLRTLRDELGERTMAGSRVIEPDRVVSKSQPLDVIGRRLALIAPGGQDAPGTLALLDETTRTLIAGSLVSIDRVPDLRDGDG